MHEHPTQALLDAFTIRERKGRLAGLKVAIVGDLLHSRVLRSNVLLLTKLGADVWVCAPATLIPPGLPQMGVRVTTKVDEAVDGADVIMMLRIQLERMQGGYFPSLREYFTTFGMTEARVKRAKPDAIINAGDGMHEHPTQALLDAYTIREHKKKLDGLKVAIVGDLLHSRVLRSNVHLLNTMGAEVWEIGRAHV